MRVSGSIKTISAILALAASQLSWASEARLGLTPTRITPLLESLQGEKSANSSSLIGDAQKQGKAALAQPAVSGQIRQALESARAGKFQELPLVQIRNGNQIQVDLRLTSVEASQLEQLTSLGLDIEVINSSLQRVQAWVTAEQLQALTQLSAIAEIRAPHYATVRAGSVQTEGDAILRSNLVRNMGVDGSGVKVGVISDGANNLSDAQASNNLPANVTRFGSCSLREENISTCSPRLTCNEGTAMAEIIHDIAPGAEIAIAAVRTDLEFIQRLNQLANNFGADIIVDDLGFFGEPFFEDGPLADAVSNLPEDVIYVSSAGNSGNNHYESEFELAPSSASSSLQLHDFGGDDTDIGFVVPARGFVVPILQWNTPFEDPAADYDMFIVDDQNLVARAADDQTLPGANPFEAACIPNTSSSDVANFVLIDKFSGADHRLELFFLGSPAIEHPVPQGSIFGHPGVANAIAVGTINASEPGNDAIAFYSSQGPARIDFPSRDDREKPDVTGIDGVRVSGAGGFPSPFFGTSAAAPHVAGVAALLKSVSPRVTAKNVRDALERGAVDLGSNGFDRVFGHGRIDALSAKNKLMIGVPLPPFIILLDDEDAE